ncbi:OB-fold nucleic acid binding domain-containing protein, partial [Lactobacillus acetotolerans]
MAKNEMNDQLRVRRQKLEELRDKGIEPYGARKFDRQDLASTLEKKYGKDDKEELNNDMPKTKIAGRMLAKRGKGKVGFADLYDRTGKIQIYVRKDIVGDDNYKIFKKSDIGDFLGIDGEVMKTDTGELTIRAHHVTFLAKALRPLPDKYHGLKDVEQIYRQRYLDLITNRKSYMRFVHRTQIIQAIRDYLNNRHFLEVETP